MLSLVQNPEKNRAGDIVRNIPDNPQSTVHTCERGKIHRKNIARDHFRWCAGKVRTEMRDSPFVKFDCNQPFHPGGQQRGQHSFTRSDLQHNVIPCRSNRFDDLAGDVHVPQKVLTQGFSRTKGG